MELHIYEIFLQLDNPRSMYVQTALLRHYYHMQALQIFDLLGLQLGNSMDLYIKTFPYLSMKYYLFLQLDPLTHYFY